MSRQALADELLDALRDIPQTPTTFNQYTQTETGLDCLGAAELREYNLRTYVESTSKGGALIVGEAPGFKGARFSGVPMTSERQLVTDRIPCFGMQTSREGRPIAEATATMFWEALRPYRDGIFVWNAFPIHPHGPDGVTNRTPTDLELRDGARALNIVKEHQEPIRILAVGNVASQQLRNMGVQHQVAPHPSRGGKAEFNQAIQEVIDSMFRKWGGNIRRD